MPRVRRLRREAPTLELLAATLPKLRLGLSEAAAKTLAYEVFEKLGYGAVAVTDRSRVLAFVGDGANDELAGAERVGMRAVLIHRDGDEPQWDEVRDWQGPRITTIPQVLSHLDG